MPVKNFKIDKRFIGIHRSLRLARILKEMSHHDLMRATGNIINQTELSLFERGHNKMSNEKIELIIKVLGYNLNCPNFEGLTKNFLKATPTTQ